MRIVFMGTPGFSAAILDNLRSQHDVVGVFTRPDAVRGRGSKLVPSPVKAVAQSGGITVFTPSTLRDAQVQQQIADLRPDIIVVAAYGAILPKEVLDIPPLGCLNVHASLLPRWRGAAPIERAILASDKQTGVCVMRMEEGLDTGDYCICRTTSIEGKSATELTAELADLGSQALLTALTLLAKGSIEWHQQDGYFATYAAKVEKHEFFLKPADRSRKASLKVQASSAPHPARCMVASRQVTVTKVSPVASRAVLQGLHGLRKGRIMLYQKKLYLGFCDYPLELVEVRPDGKRTMSAADFAAGIQNVKSGLITWEALDD